MKLIFKIFKLLITFFIIIVIIGGCAIGYAFFVEPIRVVTETIEIADNEIVEETSIVIFADTHFKEDYTAQDFKKVVEEINNMNPDIVIFLGDLFDDYANYTLNHGDTSTELNNISANIGKYAVFGNHDYGGGAQQEYEKIMENGGFQVLINETISFDSRNVTLTGIDDFLLGYGDVSVVDSINTSSYNIVMCHEPDIMDDAMNMPVDLMVSAHTHGGQIQIPFYKSVYLPSLGKKYVQGKYEFDNDAQSLLYVNRGIGTTRMTARFLSSPEVTLIKLTNK